MTIELYFTWAFLVLLAAVCLYLVQRPLRRKIGWIGRTVAFAIKIMLLPVLGYIIIIYDSSRAMAYIMGACYVAVLGDVFADILFFLIKFVKGKLAQRGTKIKDTPGWLQCGCCLTCVLVIFVVGTANMQVIVPRNHTYSSPKLEKSHRFIFLSDLHVGTAQSSETVEKLLAEIKNSTPDFVVLGGDITDEYTSKEEMIQLYQGFASIEVPVYFVYGNHDRQNNATFASGDLYTIDELVQTMESCGITILQDEVAEISEDLIIIGREDFSTGVQRAQAQDLPVLNHDAYAVAFDHQPYDADAMLAVADLQFSGHSHSGQLLPLNLIYGIFGYFPEGDYAYGDATMYVTPGASGWCIPFRTAARCRYEIVTLVPAK